MDNLTHTFFGWALARAGFDRFGKWATPTMLIAANLPDAEVPLLFGDKANYLTYHRGVSHSFFGFVIEALVLSTFVCTGAWLWRRTRRDPFSVGAPDPGVAGGTPASQLAGEMPAHHEKPLPKFFTVMLVALVGLLSHLLLDFFNTYGVRPLLPFDGRWFYGDMLFIIDPWTWMILGAGLFIGSRRHRSLQLGWLLIAGFALAVIVSACRAQIVSWEVLGVWLALAAFALMLKTWPLRWVAPSRAARGALAVWTLYLLGIAFAGHTAIERSIAAYHASVNPAQEIVKTSASPTPATPWSFTIVLQTNSDLYAYTADVLHNQLALKEHLRRNLALAGEAAIQNTREYRAWQAFARHPCCACCGGIVTLFDGRYRAAAGGDWTAFHIRVLRDGNRPPRAVSADNGQRGVPSSFPLMRGSLPE